MVPRNIVIICTLFLRSFGLMSKSRAIHFVGNNPKILRRRNNNKFSFVGNFSFFTHCFPLNFFILFPFFGTVLSFIKMKVYFSSNSIVSSYLVFAEKKVPNFMCRSCKNVLLSFSFHSYSFKRYDKYVFLFMFFQFVRQIGGKMRS